jgi:hypothetical protein
MVATTYLERKPAGPSPLQRFFDQSIMPVAIDAAACLDIGAVKAGQQLRRNPMLGIGLLLGIGYLVGAASRRRHS